MFLHKQKPTVHSNNPDTTTAKRSIEEKLQNKSIEEKNIIINGVKVNYLEAGSGKNYMLLIHGGLNSTAFSTWSLHNSMIESFSKNFKVIAPDLPGYGASENPSRCTQEYYLNFVKDFMDVMGIEKTNMIGASMGGGIALGFSMKNPDRVHSLVLVGPYGLSKIDAPGPIRFMARFPKLSDKGIKFLHRHNKIVGAILSVLKDEEKEEYIKKGIKMVNKEGVQKAFYEFLADEAKSRNRGFKTDYSESISTLNDTGIKLLIVTGEKDPFVSAEDVKNAASKVRGARVAIIDGCTHAPHYQKPEEFKSIVWRFVMENEISELLRFFEI
jgi:pimeloyl-ACP methyl ester carboxylesterase